MRVLAVLGSGGHTTEMLRIVKILDDEFMPLSFVYAETDKHSSDQVQEVIEKPYSVRTIPRARFVNLRLEKFRIYTILMRKCLMLSPEKNNFS